METARLFFDSEPLPDWLQMELPYRRRVFTGGEYRIHFVDEGSGPPVVLQHGNPTWCYLWRKVIRILLQEKVRVIAPDLIGLGLSDKPQDLRVHSLDFHGRRMSELVNALDLKNITIVGQDWGGPIMGMVAALNTKRIHGAVFANTAVRAPTRQPKVTPFHRLSNLPLISQIVFRLFNFPVPVLHMVQGDRKSIGPNEKRAYRYPLRAYRDRIAPLALARMVPTSLHHPTVKSLQLVGDWARSFEGPVQLVWGMKDPILGRALHGTQELFPGADTTRTAAGHFLQEEVPEVLAQAILKVVSRVEEKA
jgi:pimeloyl-ACP methyl ester carboxylesterase